MQAPVASWCEETASRREQVRVAVELYRQSRDGGARDVIVAAYQGLAYSLAGRFLQRGEDVEDLNQVALIGLLKAIDRFDPSRGAELSTFATATIIGELKRHLRDRAWSVRPPRRVHDLHFAAQQAIDELAQRYRRSPTVTEVAEYLSSTPEEVVEALDAGGLRNSTSLEVVVGGGEESSLTLRFGDNDARLADVERQLVLSPLLARLPERERLVIRLRFVEGWSQTEIATLIGVSQMQISRMLARSLGQLRAWSEPGSA